MDSYPFYIFGMDVALPSTYFQKVLFLFQSLEHTRNAKGQ